MKKISKLTMSILIASLAGFGSSTANAQINNQGLSKTTAAQPEKATNRLEAIKALIKNRTFAAKTTLQKKITEFPEHEIHVTASFGFFIIGKFPRHSLGC